MNRRWHLLLMLVLTLAGSPARADSDFDISGSAWFNEGTESPSMCMKFLPDGTLVFEGGYLFYNPSHWARSADDPDLVDIRLGGKERFPTFAFKDQLSRAPNQGLVSFDEKKRLLTYRMDHGLRPIEFMTFIFYRQERCDMPKSPAESRSGYRPQPRANPKR